MSGLDSISIIVIALGGVVAILVAYVVYLHLYLSRIQKSLFELTDTVNSFSDAINRCRGDAERVDLLSRAVSDASSDQLLVRELFEALSSRCDALEDRMENVQEQQSQEPESKLYTHAARLVKSGATPEEVMTECELSRAEVDLLFSLHGKDRQRQSANNARVVPKAKRN